MKGNVYVAVSNDKYEYILVVFDKPAQLARWAKKSKNSIFRLIKLKKVDKDNNCRYEKVNMERKYD